MPDFFEISEEIVKAGLSCDIIRKKYLGMLFRKTRRNTILYYSSFLQKTYPFGSSIDDYDKNGFMTVIHGLDRSIGLDLILHTPGGGMAETESLVDYLRRMFGTNIRAIIPQIAMSGGTMIACSCKEIIMGKQSSLGPIDPQINSLPAHGIIEEFKEAAKEINANQNNIPLWQPIIAKYWPTLIGECGKAIDWSIEMTKEWLKTGMFDSLDDLTRQPLIDSIIKELGDHALTKSHARHLSIEKCKLMGLKIIDLEQDQKLQDLILSIHHTCMRTFETTNAVKIIENQKGVKAIRTITLKT